MKKYNKIELNKIALSTVSICATSTVGVGGAESGTPTTPKEGGARGNQAGISPTSVDAHWDGDL